MVFLGTMALVRLLLPLRGAVRWRLGGRARGVGFDVGALIALVSARTGLANRDNDVRLLITQVAALLQAGAPPGAAWRRAAGVRVDSIGVPDLADLTSVFGAETATALVGASRLAASLGAPLATVLHTTGKVLTAESEAAAERAAILAGPQTTARVLLCLPLLGMALGWLLGANPLAAALSGGVATVSVVSGLLLLLVGRAWIARLISAANRGGA